MSLSSDVIERLVVEVTGTNRVPVFDHPICRRVWGGVDRAQWTLASRLPASTTTTP